MFMTTVIKSLSINNDILNANMTSWHKPIYHNLSVSFSWQLEVKLSCGWLWHWLS